jgi:hypothetical protein
VTRDGTARYWRSVEALDHDLDAALADIRRRQDDGQLTTRQAAAERIAALEAHLAAVARLRAQYLGDEAAAGPQQLSEIQELLRPTGWHGQD